MIFYFAPLEGLSDSIFRRAHAEHFGGVDKYFIPFLTPNQNHCFSGREKRDISPVQNAGLPVVPQLLTNCAAHFLWAAAELHTMGYQEINLNLGCPSATVTAKKKGAGQLDDLFALSAFLSSIPGYATNSIRGSRIWMPLPRRCCNAPFRYAITEIFSPLMMPSGLSSRISMQSCLDAARWSIPAYSGNSVASPASQKKSCKPFMNACTRTTALLSAANALSSAA